MSAPAWDRYAVLVATVANGPHRTPCEDELAVGGQRSIQEVKVEVWVDLYCRRCDGEIAALEPGDVGLADIVSVIAAHEPVCVAAPSWPAEEVARA